MLNIKLNDIATENGVIDKREMSEKMWIELTKVE
jgi:hypothetical protein